MSVESKGRPIPRLPAGFEDVFAEDLAARREMIEAICRVYARFGFMQLETPAIEYLDILGKYLPESDEPEGGVFAQKDDDGQWISLRYDLTAPLSRVVAQYRDKLPNPYRRYQVGPVWRREKPGPGRFRQFTQCDFDTVGSRSPAADAEVCAVLCATMAELGIAVGDYEIRVNNRKVLNGVLDRAGIGDAGQQLAVLRAIDKLDRLGSEGVGALLGPGRRDPSGDFTPGARLSPEQIDTILDFVGVGVASRPAVIERLRHLVGNSPVGSEGVDELQTIDTLLDSMGLPPEMVRFDTTVVRGLGYYTGPVFEAVLTFPVAESEGPSRVFGSVAGGGRYDDLVERFTGAKVPATGASIGVDRLLSALKTLGKLDRRSAQGPVVVTVMSPEHLADYQAMVSDLRRAGIAAELYLGDRGFGAQIKYADNRRAPAAVIAGEDEFGDGSVSIKDMKLGARLAGQIDNRDAWRKGQPAQRRVPRDQLVAAIREIIER